MRKILVYAYLIITVFIAALPLKVLANDYEYYSSNNITFYSKTSNCISSLIGNDNLEKIMRFLVGKGLTVEQAAGIAGNIEQESTFDPTAINTDAGIHYGIVQWDESRAANLKKNSDYDTLAVQLDFMWEELNGSYSNVLSAIKDAATPEEAAKIFEGKYEISGGSAIGNRIKYANEIYDLYKSFDFSSGTSTSSGQCLGGTYAGNFRIYDQNDPSWKNITYLNGTVGSIGCGITSMAMIITALTGQSVTPADTANYIAQQPPGLLEYILPSHWGLETTDMANNMTVADVNDVLNSGGLVIAHGHGTGSPYSTIGHYIVIRAVTEDGKWLIGDPGTTSNSNTEWDPVDILKGPTSGVEDSGMWAITKK